MFKTNKAFTALALVGVFALAAPTQEAKANYGDHENFDDPFFGYLDPDQSLEDDSEDCWFQETREPKCVAQMISIGASPVLCPVIRVLHCPN